MNGYEFNTANIFNKLKYSHCWTNEKHLLFVLYSIEEDLIER